MDESLSEALASVIASVRGISEELDAVIAKQERECYPPHLCTGTVVRHKGTGSTGAVAGCTPERGTWPLLSQIRLRVRVDGRRWPRRRYQWWPQADVEVDYVESWLAELGCRDDELVI